MFISYKCIPFVVRSKINLKRKNMSFKPIQKFLGCVPELTFRGITIPFDGFIESYKTHWEMKTL